MKLIKIHGKSSVFNLKVSLEQFKTYYNSILTMKNLKITMRFRLPSDKNKLTKLYYEDVYSHDIEKIIKI